LGTADLAKLSRLLVALLKADLTPEEKTAVYPNGTGQPSVANMDVRIFEGWPTLERACPAC